MFNPYVILILLLVWMASAIGTYNKGEDKGIADTTAHYEFVLSQQKADAAKVLADQTQMTLRIERKFAEFAQQQGAKDANAKQTIDDLRLRVSERLRNLPKIAPECRGRNRSAPSPSASDPRSDPANAPEAAGVLPDSTTDDAWLHVGELMFQADQINIAYESCKALLVEERN